MLATALINGEPASLPADALLSALPAPLIEDASMMALLRAATWTNYYVVNQDNPASAYVLAALGLRGPGSTIAVMKIGLNGAILQTTWRAGGAFYMPVSRDGAIWAARRKHGGSATVTRTLLRHVPGVGVRRSSPDGKWSSAMAWLRRRP